MSENLKLIRKKLEHLARMRVYLELNYLVQHAKGVITDSGGITEETTVMGVPCLTLRDNTERPETVMVGTNESIGTDPAKLGPALARLMAGKWKEAAIPEKWDGKAAVRIVAVLERLLGGGVTTSQPNPSPASGTGECWPLSRTGKPGIGLARQEKRMYNYLYI